MNADEFNDAMMATTRRCIDTHGVDGVSPDGKRLLEAVYRSNQKCLDDLAFAIGKATRNDDESPIVRATVAPKVGRHG